MLAAVFDVIRESGYDGLSVESVAERSHVHKTTIYRRWGSISEVLVDAVLEHAERAIPLERTDDVRADLTAMGKSVAENLENPVAGALAAAVLGSPGDGELRAVADRFWEIRLLEAGEIIADARAVSDPGTSIEPRQIIEMIVGPIWFRVMILGQPVDDAYIETLVDNAMSGL